MQNDVTSWKRQFLQQYFVLIVYGHCQCTQALLDPHIDLAAAENLLVHYMAHHASAREEK